MQYQVASRSRKQGDQQGLRWIGSSVRPFKVKIPIGHSEPVNCGVADLAIGPSEYRLTAAPLAVGSPRRGRSGVATRVQRQEGPPADTRPPYRDEQGSGGCRPAGQTSRPSAASASLSRGSNTIYGIGTCWS